MQIEELERFFSSQARVNLVHGPTEITELHRVSSILGGPRIFMKRDDHLIPPFGGNKVRKLEFILGDALAKNSDSLVTSGHLQSNHARLTATVARKLGLDISLVLYAENGDSIERELQRGNLFLDYLLGARVSYVEGYDALEKKLSEVVGTLQHKGRKPYLIPTAGYSPLGALGELACFIELCRQTDDLGIKVDHIITSSGSGGTQSGLILGSCLLDRAVNIIGISDGAPKLQLQQNVNNLIEETLKLLRLNIEDFFENLDRQGGVVIYDEYFENTEKFAQEVADSTELLAKEEGIFLDSSYTGKAMHGLVQLINKRSIFSEDDVVVFLHTGGSPMIFSDHLGRRFNDRFTSNR